MSETTAETWAVVDEAGVIHGVDVSEGRTGSPPWVAHVADGTARRSLTSARDAVVLMAQARGWSVAEVLAPGQETRASEVAAMRDEIDALPEMLRVGVGGTEPPKAAKTDKECHEAIAVTKAAGRYVGHSIYRKEGDEFVFVRHATQAEDDAWVVVYQTGLAAGWRMIERAEAMAAEVARLEARRGALLAEVDRLAARDRDAGVVIEDLRKMLAGASVDLAAARDDAAQARLDGAREMREQPVAWGAMPTAAEVAAHVARAEPYPHVGAPWLRRYIAFDGSDVTGIEVVYLYVDRERVMTRRPTHSSVYGATVREIASEWRPVDGDGVAVVLTGGAQ